MGTSTLTVTCIAHIVYPPLTGEWAKAQIDFFEAFRNYDEAGSPQRTQVLKYLVLAHMLMGSDIDPFDSQETKPYKNDRQIQAMTNLVTAYQRREVHEAEKIIRGSFDIRSTFLQFANMQTQKTAQPSWMTRSFASISTKYSAHYVLNGSSTSLSHTRASRSGIWRG